MHTADSDDKVVDIRNAIKKYVRPGAVLYIGELTNALVRELTRQFWGSKPEFTIISSGISKDIVNLVHCGLVAKIITSFCAEFYPKSGPQPIIQRAYKAGKIEIENWTLCSIAQRLMAGALGLPFTTTQSLVNSSMAEENKETFQMISDPFGSGQCCGIIKALNPDIAFIHGWAANRDGNVITPTYLVSGDGAWGAKASIGGTIVSVEQIVTTPFIIKHSSLATIPSYMVKSVSLAPLGAHPEAMVSSTGIKQFESYGHDLEFIAEYMKAISLPEKLDEWIKEWVLNTATHEDYLQKLGPQRIVRLKDKASRKVGRHRPVVIRDSKQTYEYSPTVMLVVAAGRRIQKRVLSEKHATILCGIGTSSYSSWLAFFKLKEIDYPVELIVGSGLYGLTPQPGKPFMLDIEFLGSAKVSRTTIDAYGIWVAGKTAKCISVLGAAEVDKNGNLNSTKLSANSYFVGSGGANDASAAKDVIILANQSQARFKDKVYYITCSGENVRYLVSDMGVFEKGDKEELELTAYYPTVEGDCPEAKIKSVRNNCGWDLRISQICQEEPQPSFEELGFVRNYSFGDENC